MIKVILFTFADETPWILTMLSGDFFKIKSIESIQILSHQQHFSAVIELNPDHPIFNGHFPGQPVVPGVCQIQIIKELLEQVLGQKTRLTESDNIKFLALADPTMATLIETDCMVKYTGTSSYHVTASLTHGNRVILKFKGIFEQEPNQP